MFNSVKQVCRKSLCNICVVLISEFHSLGTGKHYGTVLANIFLKNFSSTVNPRTPRPGAVIKGVEHISTFVLVNI